MEMKYLIASLILLTLSVFNSITFAKSLNYIPCNYVDLSNDFIVKDFITTLKRIKKIEKVIVSAIDDIGISRNGSGCNAHLEFKINDNDTIVTWEPCNGYCFSGCIDDYVLKYEKILQNKLISGDRFVALLVDKDGELTEMVFIN